MEELRAWYRDQELQRKKQQFALFVLACMTLATGYLASLGSGSFLGLFILFCLAFLLFLKLYKIKLTENDAPESVQQARIALYSRINFQVYAEYKQYFPEIELIPVKELLKDDK